MPYSRKKVAVLVSGSGSNLQALIDACAAPDFPAAIVLVISNKAEAYGLTRAKNAGIPTCLIPHAEFTTREAFDDAIHQALVEHDIDMVCLAGFMRLLTPGFVAKWHGRMLNIHPSLLPAFKGLRTHREALKAGVAEHGCTVHLVTPELDAGPVLMQAKVPVLPGDTEATLAARVLEQEHILYPQALRVLASMPHV